MKNDPTTPVQNATGHSKTGAHSTRITKRFIRFLNRYDLEILVVAMLASGAVLLVLAFRVIANAA